MQVFTDIRNWKSVLTKASAQKSKRQLNDNVRFWLCYSKQYAGLQADLSESREHASHGLVVESLGAVHDDDIHAKRLAKVLYSLRLASAGRALRRATLVQVQRRRQRYVAPAT